MVQKNQSMNQSSIQRSEPQIMQKENQQWIQHGKIQKGYNDGKNNCKVRAKTTTEKAAKEMEQNNTKNKTESRISQSGTA